MTMKICMLTTSFPRYEGDFWASFAYEQAKELVDIGVEVDVVTFRFPNTKKYEIRDNINVHRFQYIIPVKYQKLGTESSAIPTELRESFIARLQLPFFLISFLWKSLKVCRKCDIIHAQWALSGLIAVILKNIYKKPVVLTIHGAEVYMKIGIPIIRYVIEKVDYVIFNSSYTMRRTLEISPPKSHSVIHPCINTADFSSRKNDTIRKKLGISTETPIIFTLGRLVERKGFEYLIKAMPLILDKHNKVHLVIGGTGPQRGKLNQLIENLNITDHATLAGHISEKELPSYYSEAEVFVLPAIIDSRGDTEGLGMVLIEAMACGKPVIGSNVGGIPDVITPDVGFLVEQKNPRELAEKIIYLLENDDIREEMRKNARKRVEEKFTWEKAVEDTKKVYEGVLG